MERYKDIDHDSGVIEYEYGDNWITVVFAKGKNTHYKYESSRIGQPNIDKMKRLADQGEGLNAFINTNRSITKEYTNRW